MVIINKKPDPERPAFLEELSTCPTRSHGLNNTHHTEEMKVEWRAESRRPSSENADSGGEDTSKKQGTKVATSSVLRDVNLVNA